MLTTIVGAVVLMLGGLMAHLGIVNQNVVMLGAGGVFMIAGICSIAAEPTIKE